MGGGYDDTGIAIAVDGSGNVYVAGTSFGEWGSPVQEFAAWYNSTDAFVAKLGSGGSLVWNTFLGGEGSGYDYSLGNESGFGIAVDSSGNVYVAGNSNSSWWGNPSRNGRQGSYDAFVAKLGSNGSLVWNTFLGGGGSDAGNSIAVDGSGNVYVAGNSSATWGSPVRALSGARGSQTPSWPSWPMFRYALC